MWNDVKEGISFQFGFFYTCIKIAIEVSIMKMSIGLLIFYLIMISSVLATTMAGKEDDSRKWFLKFKIVEDKEFLVHAILGVPILGWPTEVNSPTTKIEIVDLWVNGIVMIVVAYS